MTQTIDQKNLERKLIRGFALADAWFDFVDDGITIMTIGERILAILSRLQRMLGKIKPVPIQDDTPAALTSSKLDAAQYFNALYLEELVTQTNDPEVRHQLREHLYYCLVLLELESTHGLRGKTVTLRDGRTLAIPEYVRLVVFTVETLLAELNEEALTANPG